MKENHVHFKQCKNEDKLIPKITRLEEYFPSLSISDYFTFDFRYHQFSETRLWYVCIKHQTEKKTFEIPILPTVKFRLHIPISLLSLTNREAVTTISDSVRFVRYDTQMFPQLFYKGLLKSFYLPSALSFSPDIDTICDSRLEIDSTSSCWKKNWYEFNSIK